MNVRVFDTHPEVERLRKALRQLVEQTGIPVSELANDADLPLRSILRGNQYLRAEHIFIVLDVLHISPPEFFAGLYDETAPAGRESQKTDDDLVAGIRRRREIEEIVNRLLDEKLDERQRRGQGGGQE